MSAAADELKLPTVAGGKCHRFLNAVEPGTVVPIHRHRNTSETVVCLRGKFGGGVL